MKTLTSTQADIIKLLQTNMVVFKENLSLIVSSCIERLGSSITEAQALSGFVTILRQNYTTVPPIQELEEENQSDTISKATFKDAKNHEDSFSPRLPHYFTFKTFEQRRELLNKSEPGRVDLSLAPPSQNRSQELNPREPVEELFLKKGNRYSLDSGYLQKKAGPVMQEPVASSPRRGLVKKSSAAPVRGDATESPAGQRRKEPVPRVALVQSVSPSPSTAQQKTETTPSPSSRNLVRSALLDSGNKIPPRQVSAREIERDRAGAVSAPELRIDTSSVEYMGKIRKLMKMMTTLKSKSRTQPTIPRITSLREFDEMKPSKNRFASGSSTPSRQETRASETISQFSTHALEARAGPSSDRLSKASQSLKKPPPGRRADKERESLN